MASYDAVVNLNVVGTSRLNKVNASITELNKLTLDLNKSLNLLAPGGGGKLDKLADKLRVAFEPIKKFARDATNGVARYANTVSGAANQTRVFATVLENVNIKSGGFSSQVADVKNLANAWVGATANLTKYNNRLSQLQRTALAKQGLMQLSSGEIALGAEAGFGPQGPRLPGALGGGMTLPENVSRLAKPGLRGAQGLLTKPGVADAIIGAGFPALFGGGPGAILGGGIGGLAGGALGGPLGMALSIGLSAVGQKLDEAVATAKALGDALATVNVDKLRESFVYVNAELSTTVRRLLEAGQAQKAQQMLAAEAAKQSAILPEITAYTTQQSTILNNKWNELLSVLGGSVSILAGAITPVLTIILNIVTKIQSLANNLASRVMLAIGDKIDALLKKFPFIVQFINWLVGDAERLAEEEQRRTALLQEATDRLAEQVVLATKLDKLKESEVSNATFYGQILNEELRKKAELIQLEEEFNKKRREARVEYAGLDLEDHMRKLDQLEQIKRKEIERNSEEKKRILLLKQADADRTLALQQQTSQLNLQSNAIQQQLNLVQAQAQAQTTINNIEIQTLERVKDMVTAYDTKIRIINKILRLEVANAKIAFDSAVAQIRANERLAELARIAAVQKLKNLEIDLLSAAAKGEEVTNYQKAVMAGKEAVDIATQNLDFTRQIGAEQLRAAEATYNAAVQAANLKAQTSAAAVAAERFAGAMSDAATAAGAVVEATNTFAPGGQNPASVTRRLGGINAMQLLGAQDRMANIYGFSGARYGLSTERASEMNAEFQQRREALSQDLAANIQNLRATPTENGVGTPSSINIQTGPVLQQDGNKYVTLEDMESALQSMASTMYSSNRSAGTQRLTGVR